MPIRAQPGRCDSGIAPVVLGPGDADAITQPLELLGIDRVHGKAAVQKASTTGPCGTSMATATEPGSPATDTSQSHRAARPRSAVRERPLAHNVASPIEQAHLLSTPLDPPTQRHLFPPLFLSPPFPRPSRSPPRPLWGLGGRFPLVLVRPPGRLRVVWGGGCVPAWC